MKYQMTAQHEKLLVATLAGLVIVCAAAFAVTPASAAQAEEDYTVERPGEVTGVAWWDQLDVRKWPYWYAAPTGRLEAGANVFVERCAPAGQASRWCHVTSEGTSGWVNATYLDIDPLFAAQ